uniref:Cytochrome c oxidase subunit 2 n=1 Tax=Nocticola sp. JW1 9/1 TaxID=2093475 RepID=A0A2P1H9G7_9NEOP|nr:cytochrome c oxidase subunit 2 [Nocticola sp. JW1 9/1]
MATWSNFNLQNSASPSMEQLIFFHDHTMMIMLMIMSMTFYIILFLLMDNLNNKFTLEEQNLETLWTIFPVIILMFIAYPSLHILYILDEIKNPLMTIKTIGHQWYWTYEMADFTNQEIASYMTPQALMNKDSFRLLDVDNRLPIPMNTQIRMIITASDVIHSWTIPSLGIKADATPGRLNQLSILTTSPSIMFGQCSEICGANHSFMPIVIESLPINNMIDWLISNN